MERTALKNLREHISSHFSMDTLPGSAIDTLIIILNLISSAIFVTLTHPISDSSRSI